LQGGGATAPSIIRRREKVHGGEKAPRNGTLALPKYVAVKPFCPKGLLNATLSLLILVRIRRPNSSPSGHANLGRGFPGLKHDFFDGVLVIEVPSAPFRPKVVEEKAPQDVERLTTVSETALVVAMKVRWVVFTFKDGFTQKHGGPSDAEVVGNFPFVPYVEEGVPRLLSQWAFHQAVLSGLQKSLVAPLASGLNAHDLKPGAHGKSVVENQPGESAHLARSGVVPDLGNDLSNRCVAQV
jgi:hypothetical protein